MQSVINKIFNDYIIKHGKPKRIQADHGTQFTSKKWINKLKTENIICSFSSIRHPQAAIVERCNKEIKRFFRTFISLKNNNKHGAWINYVKIKEKIINEIHHETTEITPIESRKGVKPERFWEKYFLSEEEIIPHKKLIFSAKERIARKQEKSNFKINEIGKSFKFSLGEKVLLKFTPILSAEDNTMASFFDIYEGPFVVSRKFRNAAYELNHMNTDICFLRGHMFRGVFHIDDSKPFIYESNAHV